MTAPDRMPERVWLWDTYEGMTYSLTPSAWGLHEYLRATPEMLAMIEAVEAMAAALISHPVTETPHYHCSAGCEKAQAQLRCVKCGAAWVECTPDICGTASEGEG